MGARGETRAERFLEGFRRHERRVTPDTGGRVRMDFEATGEPDFHTAIERGSDAEFHSDLALLAPVPAGLEGVVTPGALTFLAELARRFRARRSELLEARRCFQARLRRGERPGFLEETRAIREATWAVRPAPPDLQDRRVEITGPVDRKMVINALNSGAQAYMADFEDSHAPTWEGTLQGQLDLMDAVRGTIEYRTPSGRQYRLGSPTATLLVRPRGWHLDERNAAVDGERIPASLFDFGLFAYHNARELLDRGSGPYLYLPKLEHHAEAALWNEVFEVAEIRLGLPRGAIRATVLIETLPAVFEMEEILYALRERATGLNGGRWDYLFSFIKQFRDDPTVRFPDRAQLPMTAPFLDAYARLLVDTCHRRGAHAIGGMAAQIPIRDNPEASRAAIDKVVADKERELRLGYDGTWVAHPGLVPVAREVFERGFRGPNQIARRPSLPADIPEQLLAVPAGTVTAAGLRSNVRASLRYLESWLRGIGCVPIDHLMEDAATVEIARAQLWHWIQRQVRLEDGRTVTPELVRSVLAEERWALLAEPRFEEEGRGSAVLAATFLDALVTGPEFPEFFTLPASELLAVRGG